MEGRCVAGRRVLSAGSVDGSGGWRAVGGERWERNN